MKLKLILTTAIVGVALALPARFAALRRFLNLRHPTLSGESFHQDTPTITSGTCTESESGATFEAGGTATGPYPGTFQETGSYLVIHPGGHAISYDLTMSFTIDSPLGRVTGTKHSTNFGSSCSPLRTLRTSRSRSTPLPIPSSPPTPTTRRSSPRPARSPTLACSRPSSTRATWEALPSASSPRWRRLNSSCRRRRPSVRTAAGATSHSSRNRGSASRSSTTARRRERPAAGVVQKYCFGREAVLGR